MLIVNTRPLDAGLIKRRGKQLVLVNRRALYQRAHLSTSERRT